MQKRDLRIDRAKGCLIFLVVLGHLLAAVTPWDSDALRVPLTLIYSFHMPAFVLLAGITAKSNRLAERVGTYLVLLAAAVPALWLWMRVMHLDPDFDFLVPYWLTWFLVSMAWWTLSTPLIERFPRATLVASLACGLFGGIVPVLDYELSFARTLAFWPFFVIGKLYGKRIMAFTADLTVPRRLGLTVLALCSVALFYHEGFSKLWFYGSRGFDYLGVDVPTGVGMRLIVAIGAGLMTLALLSWIRDTPGVLAVIGQRSLAVYLLHGFVVRGLNPVLDGSLDHVPAPVMFLVCTGIAAATTMLFSWRPFDAGLRWYSTTLTRLLLAPFRALASSVRGRREAAPEAAPGPDTASPRRTDDGPHTGRDTCDSAHGPGSRRDPR